MKRNIRTAFNQLKKIGAPVFEGGWDGQDTFRISGEHNYDGETWADYYEEFCPSDWEFGVNPRITQILDKNRCYAEWCNPGVLNVYEV